MTIPGLALAALLALPAQAATAVGGTPAGSQRAQQPPSPRGVRAGLEARVATLTRALGLDARQQATLRQALVDQRQQVQRIWSDRSVSARDRVAETRKVSAHTADRIRAMLTEEQRQKYEPAPQAAPDRQDGDKSVEEWMRVQQKS
jgi:hypothetical protein